jgi:tetratricopeptide (TPR) repeat protein
MSLTLMFLLAVQTAVTGPRAPSTNAMTGALTATCDVMAQGAREHFANGIDVIGKLVWPADVTPHLLDIELEDEDGNIIRSAKSESNEQFRFTHVAVVNATTCAFKNYHIQINADGLDIVRQPLSLSTSNFSGAQLTVQLHRLPGLHSRNSEAVVSINSLKQAPPKDALAAFDKAMEEQRKGDTRKSVLDFERALRIDPDFYEANLELGLQYGKDGRRDDAMRLLGRALELNPASMRARTALGRYAYESKDFEKTTDLLKVAVQLGETSGDVYFMLGMAYINIDEMDLAEASLLRSLAIAPGKVEIHLALHNIYIKWRQLDRALKELDIFLQEYPDAPEHDRIQAEADKLRKVLQPRKGEPR